MRTLILGAAALVASIAAPAFAQTSSTSDLSVTATVPPTCEITNAEALDFGDVGPVEEALGQSDVTLACTADTAFSLTANTGTTGGRTLTDGVSSLSYVLYSDQTRATPLTATAGIADTSDATTGAATATIYARIPAAAANTARLASDALEDTVTLTVTY
ncbi:spore coat protein U domain-containing protein [Brevundimonas sp.]|uniref:spore coat protein U domain-containing protein n=1 Tax=Brevundimonas sp. TaxID=1871086 RepID=UPI0037BEE613